jgi:hypothetical protein
MLRKLLLPRVDRVSIAHDRALLKLIVLSGKWIEVVTSPA